MAKIYYRKKDGDCLDDCNATDCISSIGSWDCKNICSYFIRGSSKGNWIECDHPYYNKGDKMSNLETLEQKYKELGKEIAELKKNSNIDAWYEGKIGFFIDNGSEVINTVNEEWNNDTGMNNNLHISREDAEHTLLYIQWKKVARFIENGVREYSIGEANWSPRYNPGTEVIEYSYSYAALCHADLNFSSEDNAKKAVKLFGEDNFIKLCNMLI